VTVTDSLYRQRHRVSGVTTLAAALVCALAGTMPMKRQVPTYLPPDKPLTITLTALTEPVKPVVPTPAPTTPQPRPQARAQTETKQQPQKQVTRPATQANHAETQAPSPATPTRADTPSALPQTSEPAESANPAPATLAPAASPLPKGNTDHAYEASVLALVEAHKLYPTGRQAMLDRPRGTVRVCVSLSRSGVADDISIACTSGSMLLDQAAHRLVSGLTYPPFPAQGFPGETHHEFCMSVDYQSPDS
jgi:periplasmic protein TonB